VRADTAGAVFKLKLQEYSGSTLVGSNTVQATLTTSWQQVTVTYTIKSPGSTLDHIVISPATASITAGGSRTYTAQAFDASNNSLGDVTGSTTFSIAPDGS